MASEAFEIPGATHRVFFGDGVLWEGDLRGDEFLVRDIVDGGTSEAEITGRAVQMRVPLDRIAAEGGTVLPFGETP